MSGKSLKITKENILNDIKEISYSTYDYLDPGFKITFILNENGFEAIIKDKKKSYDEKELQSFLNSLLDIKIYSWKKSNYCTNMLIDGQNWELNITLKDNSKIKYKGSACFPDSFEDLEDLIEKYKN